MWSIGCILGELITGRPIFPGTSTMNQLDKIIELTGRPSEEDISAIRSPFAATMLESLPPSRPRSYAEMFPTATAEALDLMRLCLQFNPDKRLTAEDALRHPYVAQFHNIDEEPIASRPVQIAIDDNTKYTAEDYRKRLYSEIQKKKKTARRQQAQERQSQRGATAAVTAAATSSATATAAAARRGEEAPALARHHQRATRRAAS